jgi:HSP20 family protein
MDSLSMPLYDMWGSHNPIPCTSSGLFIDLIQISNTFVLTTHIPGITKDNVSIEFDNDVLTISTHYNKVHTDEGIKVFFNECLRGSSSRSIKFQYGKIDYKKISATNKNGELVIVLPFHEEYSKDVVITNVEIME